MLVGLTGGIGAGKSVVAAHNMKETLERQDSAATFFLAGQVQKARAQYQANRPLFWEAYQVEAHNITEPGEQQIADDIGRQFTAYRRDIERLLYADPPPPEVITLHSEDERDSAANAPSPLVGEGFAS